MAERVQHDPHEVRCPCGREHAAPRPAGVPGSALPVGPRLRALAVYLVVFQHVPVERCRLLIADVTGALVSDGFVHSCLAKAASLLKDVVALIRALITALATADPGVLPVTTDHKTAPPITASEWAECLRWIAYFMRAGRYKHGRRHEGDFGNAKHRRFAPARRHGVRLTRPTNSSLQVIR